MKQSTFSLRPIILIALVVCSTLAVFATKQRLNENRAVLEEEKSYHWYANGIKNQDKISSDDDWKSLVGFWQGSLNEELRLIFRVTPTYGQVFGYSLDQGGALIPASATKVDSKEIRFYFSTIGGVYRATLDPTGQRLVGYWKQGGGSASLDMRRWVQPTDKTSVPREFQFVTEKVVTGDPEHLAKMAGFWSGYLDDSFDEQDKELPVFVILQVEKVLNDLVETKIFLSDDGPLPSGIRSFMVNAAGEAKIVLDNNDANAIFQGQLYGEKLTGTVKYDDADYTPPLTLVWSADYPIFEQYE